MELSRHFGKKIFFRKFQFLEYISKFVYLLPAYHAYCSVKVVLKLSFNHVKMVSFAQLSLNPDPNCFCKVYFDLEVRS